MLRPSPRDSSRVEAVYAGLFARIPSRAEKRVVQILEATIRNFVTLGIESTTYDSIAKTCKVSRPLVQHYFKDRGELFQMVTKYVRFHLQQTAVDEVRKAKGYRAQLEAYFSSLFVWNRKYPSHVKVWNLVYYWAATDKKIRKLHTELVNMGQDRVTAMLEGGVTTKEFPPGDLRKRAKQILILFLGAIAVLPSEDLDMDLETFRQNLIDSAVRLAQNADIRP